MSVELNIKVKIGYSGSTKKCFYIQSLNVLVTISDQIVYI